MVFVHVSMKHVCFHLWSSVLGLKHTGCTDVLFLLFFIFLFLVYGVIVGKQKTKGRN